MIRQEVTREPRQVRSQRRVAQILDAARTIIARKGAATMKMSEIAALADVSVASIYQYFSNKGDIITTLADSILKEQTAQHKALLSEPPRSLVQLAHIMLEMLDSYFELHMQDPVIRDIRAGRRADKKLQDTDDDDDLANRDFIFGMSCHLFPEEEHERVKTHLLLLIKFGGAAVSMASQYEGEQARRVFEEAKAILSVTLETALFPLGRRTADTMPSTRPPATPPH